MILSISARITIRFTIYVSVFVLLLGIIVNMTVFRRRYRREMNLLEMHNPQGEILPSIPSFLQNDNPNNGPLGTNNPSTFPILPFVPKRNITVPVTNEIILYLNQITRRKSSIACDNMSCVLFLRDGDFFHMRDITQQMTMQSTLFTMSIIVFLIAMFGTFGLGYLFTKQSFRPLLDLARVVKKLRPEEYHKLQFSGPADDEIGIITISLRESYRRIHHHIISLRDFVAHASHEFKTPLATLSALVDVLDSQSPHGSDTKLYHQRMKNTLTQMNNLLDALIALTHWEHTKPMITKVFLSSIVNDCLGSIPNDNALETTSIIDASYSVWTDRAMAISIISNLIGNAYKYVPVGGKVIVAVTVADNFYILTIADTGPGIDTADRIKIFQKFRKKNTNSEGFGLGLYLVDCLCKKLGWIIALDETYVSGTKRILNIPKK